MRREIKKVYHHYSARKRTIFDTQDAEAGWHDWAEPERRYLQEMLDHLKMINSNFSAKKAHGGTAIHYLDPFLQLR